MKYEYKVLSLLLERDDNQYDVLNILSSNAAEGWQFVEHIATTRCVREFWIFRREIKTEIFNV